MVTEPLPRQSPRRQRITFAWQGWQLSVPAGWNPVTLSGSFSSGHALLADLDQPRLGLRWKQLETKRVTQAFVDQVVRGEANVTLDGQVNHLSAGAGSGADALACVYLDPLAPGRDVYALWAAGSQRLIELVYHARERDDVLLNELVPSLRESSGGDEPHPTWQPWAVFDLACAVPSGFRLRSHDLRAGDSRLNWGCRRAFVAVRQLALADLALKRTTLERLVHEAQRPHQLQYRPHHAVEHVTLMTGDERQLIGRAGRARLRRRFFWRRDLPPQRVTLALHDGVRNRIVVVEADEFSLARDVALTVGGDFK